MKYRVETENTSREFTKLEDALGHYEWKKDYLMGEGVTEDSYVEFQRSDDDFEDYELVKRAATVIDHERHTEGACAQERRAQEVAG
ncbi:hypothetical protein ABU162_26030 [Paenibacillus thiaminolyticus]|uniref:hypothetical protein n=1 Tax=Paenibacillus thiaminolyticus TaxID=49283 RepID=UPI0035A6476F